MRESCYIMARLKSVYTGKPVAHSCCPSHGLLQDVVACYFGLRTAVILMGSRAIFRMDIGFYIGLLLWPLC